MRKIYLALTVLISISASAQVKWGASAGVNFSNLGEMDLISSSRLVNFNAGLMADFTISKNVHALAELLYAPMGYYKSNLNAVDNSGNDVGKIEMHRINYISVPLYLSYSHKLKDFIFHAGVGPYFSFQAGDKLKILNGDSYRNGTVFPQGVKDINTLLTGFGFYISSEWSSVVLSMQFQQSFNSIYETNVASAPDWKINSFGVSMGYYFKKITR